MPSTNAASASSSAPARMQAPAQRRDVHRAAQRMTLPTVAGAVTAEVEAAGGQGLGGPVDAAGQGGPRGREDDDALRLGAGRGWVEDVGHLYVLRGVLAVRVVRGGPGRVLSAPRAGSVPAASLIPPDTDI
jgi:hypothetical protein